MNSCNSWGWKPMALASDQINVYGNHAGVLPYTNLPHLPTDLVLNAVRMEDGGDGQFGRATACCSTPATPNVGRPTAMAAPSTT
jgi:hypothetical protein